MAEATEYEEVACRSMMSLLAILNLSIRSIHHLDGVVQSLFRAIVQRLSIPPHRAFSDYGITFRCI